MAVLAYLYGIDWIVDGSAGRLPAVVGGCPRIRGVYKLSFNGIVV